MKIKTISSYQNADKAEGLAVVVDVLRAFTTCCFAFENGAKTIIPVSDTDTAYKLIEDNPDFVSIGERNGLKLPGFTYNNSPAEIENVDLKDKTVILTTSVGTQGIVNATNADMVITGAFVNAQAAINFIRQQKPEVVSFIITDCRYKDNEDYMYARFVESHIKGKPLNFKYIKKHLIHHPTAQGFLGNPMTEYSRKDFYLSLDLNRFNFVVVVKKRKNLIFLEKLIV